MISIQTHKMTDLRQDTRAVSFGIGYILGLLIAITLIGVIVSIIPPQVSDAQDNVANQELTVIGERMSSQIENTDSIAYNTGEVTDDSVGGIQHKMQVPDTVAGKEYNVSLEEDGDNAVLVLETNDETVTVERQIILNQTEVDEVEEINSTGKLQIVIDDNELTIERR